MRNSVSRFKKKKKKKLHGKSRRVGSTAFAASVLGFARLSHNPRDGRVRRSRHPRDGMLLFSVSPTLSFRSVASGDIVLCLVVFTTVCRSPEIHEVSLVENENERKNTLDYGSIKASHCTT